jgi:sirohydrochlorin ferrochelatase
MRTAIIIVDHGSRREESNKMLETVAALFAAQRGAERIVVIPFFLGPGKHWSQDIPSLTAAAAAQFPATQYHVGPTLGIDDLILDLLAKRACHCETHNYSCDMCKGTLRSGQPAQVPAPLIETATAAL